MNYSVPMKYCERHGLFRPSGVRPPDEVMVIFIDQHREQYGVEPICEQTRITLSNYYEYKARERTPDRLPERIKRDIKLELDIQTGMARQFPGLWRTQGVAAIAARRQDWFNNRRLLESIGNIPPAEFKMAYYQQQKESADGV
ncbi:MAG: hypothetical protein JSS37_11940 [Proteobacteria bacterium]|nr:hypothetical protein [Pseudomonadota bacterium]